MEASIFKAGDIIGAKFRLVSVLGQGGMGSVWKADHLTLNSPVAIKLIDPSIALNVEFTARFMREAQASAALRSSHVIQVFDYGVERGVPFLVMEMLKGESLRSRLDKVGTLPPQVVERIFSQVARATGMAHDAGIIHRDLKPDNIFLVQEDDQEVVKVLDFGIAKITDASNPAASSSTRTGSVMGTPYYMSPEQARGSKGIDYRSDLWSLAVVVYECMTGELPFSAEALGELIIQIAMGPIPVPSLVRAVPQGFDAWFAHAAERDPARRFQSAREMAQALRGVLVGSSTDWSTGVNNTGGMLSGVGVHATGAGQVINATTNASTVSTIASTNRKGSKGVLFAVFGGAVLVVLGAAALGAHFLGGHGNAHAALSPEGSVSSVVTAVAPPVVSSSAPAVAEAVASVEAPVVAVKPISSAKAVSGPIKTSAPGTSTARTVPKAAGKDSNPFDDRKF